MRRGPGAETKYRVWGVKEEPPKKTEKEHSIHKKGKVEGCVSGRKTNKIFPVGVSDQLCKILPFN